MDPMKYVLQLGGYLLVVAQFAVAVASQKVVLRAD